MHPNEIRLVQMGKSTRLPIPTPELEVMTREASTVEHRHALGDQLARQYAECKGGVA